MRIGSFVKKQMLSYQDFSAGFPDLHMESKRFQNIRHQLHQRLIITAEVKKLEGLDISWPTLINLKRGRNMRWRHYPYTKPSLDTIFKFLLLKSLKTSLCSGDMVAIPHLLRGGVSTQKNWQRKWDFMMIHTVNLVN